MRRSLYFEIRKGPIPRKASGSPPSFEVALGQRIVLGRRTRDGDDTIDFADQSLGRRHASLSYDDEGCWATDLGSPSGTYVNGTQVAKVLLKSGDVVCIGQVRLVAHACRPHDTNKSPAAWIEVIRQEGLTNRGRKGLERLGSSAIPALVQILENDGAEARCHAAQALGALGGQASLAVPSLIVALRDSKVREVAARALSEIGREEGHAVEALVRELERKEADRGHPVRHAADTGRREVVIYALGRIGPAAAVAVPALLEADRSGDFERGGSTKWALQKIRGRG